MFIQKVISTGAKSTSEIELDIEKIEKQYDALIKKRDAYTESIGNSAAYLAKEAHEDDEAIRKAIRNSFGKQKKAN